MGGDGARLAQIDHLAVELLQLRAEADPRLIKYVPWLRICRLGGDEAIRMFALTADQLVDCLERIWESNNWAQRIDTEHRR